MTFTIAMDGHAASGKGTISKGVAEYYGFAYLDTGLIYRAVAKLALLEDDKLLSKSKLIKISRSFKAEHLELEGLRTDQIGIYASEIASVPEVRAELTQFQRNFASRIEGAVLDGRDIGTYIIPDADLKVFVTADLSIRAKRRFKQLQKTDRNVSFPQIREDLLQRDHRDTTRQHAPLKISSEAHLIDTTELSIEASIARVVALVDTEKKKM